LIALNHSSLNGLYGLIVDRTEGVRIAQNVPKNWKNPDLNDDAYPYKLADLLNHTRILRNRTYFLTFQELQNQLCP